MFAPTLTQASAHFAPLRSTADFVRLPPISTFAQAGTQARSHQDLNLFPHTPQPSSKPQREAMNQFGYSSPAADYGRPAVAPTPQSDYGMFTTYPSASTVKSTGLRLNTETPSFGSSFTSQESATSGLYSSRNPSPASSTYQPYSTFTNTYTSNVPQYVDNNQDSQDDDAPKKRNYRKRLPPTQCSACGATETPEWRRGPTGSRSLCNACGLHYQKLFPGGVTESSDVSYQLNVLVDARKGRKATKSASIGDLSYISADIPKSNKPDLSDATLSFMGAASQAGRQQQASGLPMPMMSPSGMPRVASTGFAASYNSASGYSSTASHVSPYAAFSDSRTTLPTNGSRTSLSPSSSISSLSPQTPQDPYSQQGDRFSQQPQSGFGVKQQSYHQMYSQPKQAPAYAALSHAKSYGEMPMPSRSTANESYSYGSAAYPPAVQRGY